MTSWLGSLLSLSGALLIAAQPVSADIYQGTGQVVSGPGAGAKVSLTVNYDGQNLKRISGPPLEGSQVRVDQRGDELDLTIFRGNQVIRYNLKRVGPR
jgi:hypothetical protein